MNPASPQIRLATLITAPPDHCPDCHTANILPNYSWHQEPNRNIIYGRYNCDPCKISWDTAWKVNNLT